MIVRIITIKVISGWLFRMLEINWLLLFGAMIDRIGFRD
jgi:hypothetical protein